MRPAPRWARLASWVIPRLPFGRYVVMNKIARLSSRTFRARLPDEVGGYWFQYDPSDSIIREICFTGRYSPAETVLLRALLEPGMTFFDVGANVGYFSLLAAHAVGVAGRVVSFEPDPRVFEVLRENVRMNELDRVELLNVAAAEDVGRATLVGHPDHADNRGVSRLGSARAGDRSFDVATTSVEEVRTRRGIKTVDVVKIDVEGAELRVLKGMAAGLATAAYSRILLELHVGFEDFDYTSIRGLLQSHGYLASRIAHPIDAARRYAYTRTLKPADFMVQTDNLDPTDMWPHQLWLAPGVAAPI
jgi:FkbM family methyltransferase